MKKLISLILTLTLLLSLFNCVSLTTNAATAGTYNGFKYSVENSKATITGYNGSPTTLTIPSEINGCPVVAIDDYAFEYCRSLTSVIIPDSVTSIGSYAFWPCPSLTSITIPDSVTSIGDGAFYYTGYYNDGKNWENGALYIGNHLIEVDFTATSYTIKDGTKTIGDRAFEYCDLTSITIPDSVTSIGGSAFHECYSLTSITIPDSVTTIGNNAFSSTGYYNDDSNWENGALYIGNHLIKAETTISGSYKIKEGTKTIGDCAFAGCYSLLKVTIPDSVVSIGDNAFSGCDKIKTITIPKSVKHIGENIFSRSIESSLESIVVDAYNPYYSSKDGVLLDKNKTKIIHFPTAKSGDYIVPNTVISIDDGAFVSSKITSIEIPDSVKSIGNDAFGGCKSLNTVIIGNGVKSIGDTAFHLCYNLRNIILGNSIESIGKNAFYRCQFTSIDLPESVKSIGNFAFEECGNLESVVIRNDDIAIGDGAFYGLDNLTVTCNENSNAQEYCEEWSIPYNFTMGEAPIVPSTPESDTSVEQYIIGDVNLDGAVDIFDLIALAKMIVGA